jgi:hypothetical protein
MLVGTRHKGVIRRVVRLLGFHNVLIALCLYVVRYSADGILLGENIQINMNAEQLVTDQEIYTEEKK